jgi:chorismate synthase
MVQMGPHGIDRDRFDWARSSRTRSGARRAGRADWADYLDTLRKSGDSVGAIIEVTAAACPRASARRSTASSTPTSPPR